MMARYDRLKVLSSRELGEIQAFLSELKDEKVFNDRLKALEDLKTKINADIEVYGKANDIGRLQGEANTRHEEMKLLRNEALADRAKAVEDAAAAKIAAQASIDAREREANQRWNERERLLRDGESNLGIREKALAKANDDLIRRELQAAADLSSALDIRTAYTEAVASLKKAIEDTAKAL